MMTLEPGGLIGQQGVGGRVRLVEAIACKLFNKVENVTGQSRIDIVFFATGQKHGSLLGHFFRFFLTHRTT